MASRTRGTPRCYTHCATKMSLALGHHFSPVIRRHLSEVSSAQALQVTRFDIFPQSSCCRDDTHLGLAREALRAQEVCGEGSLRRGGIRAFVRDVPHFAARPSKYVRNAGIGSHPLPPFPPSHPLEPTHHVHGVVLCVGV